MILNHLSRAGLLGGLMLSVAACGAIPREATPPTVDANGRQQTFATNEQRILADGNSRGTSLRSLFGSGEDPNITVEVNKYIWAASLDILSFLPIQSVDPFTGVIVTGYGTPPGGGRSYRATVYVQDPALDARSLKVALQSSGGGAVSSETTRAVEDAILTRARQLRIQDSRL